MAAERRILAQNEVLPSESRYFQCGLDISEKNPFEYCDYKFCKPAIVINWQAKSDLQNKCDNNMSKKFAKLLKAVLNEIDELFPELNQEDVSLDCDKFTHFVHPIIPETMYHILVNCRNNAFHHIKYNL